MKDRLRRIVRGAGTLPPAEDSAEVNRSYSTAYPSAQNQLDLFAGEWTSAVPVPGEDTTSGPRPDLFDDPRIAWLLEQTGSIEGWDVLELGPLECGHTAMLEAAGRCRIVAIEAHARAFLRCLVVKNLLDLDVRLRFGDFVQYLERTERRFDLCVASGVLYHMTDPLHVLDLLCQRSERIFLWTHYYDREIMARRPDVAARFEGEVVLQHEDQPHRGYRYEYREGRDQPTFCGGPFPTAVWVERPTIMDVLHRAGFRDVRIAFDEPDRDHGPALALLASKG